MLRKVVLAGGAGYIGRVLNGYYRDKAASVVVLSRSAHPDHDNVRYVIWNGRDAGSWAGALEGADLLINLSGKNVNCRYNARNRAAILQSRVAPTRLLGDAIAKLAHPPKAWINITSATIYRHAEDRPQSEAKGDIGSGFSVDVCKAWEEAFFSVATPQTRKIALRTGLVLGNSDGVFPRLRNLVRLGLGGRQGNGRQRVSWIHELDLARITEWVYRHTADDTVYNATAPEVITNTALMQALRHALHRKCGLPAPAWLLEAGALLIGTETELILKSRWVVPELLLMDGFCFCYPELSGALEAIVQDAA